MLQAVIFEFPVKELKINMPGWVTALPESDWVKESIMDMVRDSIDGSSIC